MAHVIINYWTFDPVDPPLGTYYMYSATHKETGKCGFSHFWSISQPYFIQFTPYKNQHVLLSLQINVVPISRQQVMRLLAVLWRSFQKQLG